jgi:thiamine pyrophosphate-dependent acetolactate synthase large subunit-like protein
VADAKLDSVPLVCITGQVPRALIGTDAFQEVATSAMSYPVTKHSFLVRSAQELLDVIPQAFSIHLNVKIIVMNNNSLGLVHQQQQMFYEKRVFAAEFRTQTNFVAIAAGFGMKGYDLALCSDPLATLSEALERRGPCLINAPIDVRQHVLPMVPPGAANREMIGGEANVETCV